MGEAHPAASRSRPVLGCAALLGAAVAFPAGLMVGSRSAPKATAGHAPPLAPGPARRAGARNAFSPNVTGDPYVIEQQRRVTQALEVECRQSGRLCAEADQARLRIEEAEARR